MNPFPTVDEPQVCWAAERTINIESISKALPPSLNESDENQPENHDENQLELCDENQPELHDENQPEHCDENQPEHRDENQPEHCDENRPAQYLSFPLALVDCFNHICFTNNVLIAILKNQTNVINSINNFLAMGQTAPPCFQFQGQGRGEVSREGFTPVGVLLIWDLVPAQVGGGAWRGILCQGGWKGVNTLGFGASTSGGSWQGTLFQGGGRGS